MTTGVRKDDHLRIVREEDVSSTGVGTGLEAFRFVHQALPEIDLEEVDTSVHFLGHLLSFPMLISSMTGGTPLGGDINQILARAAVDAGIAMGLGSTRAMLETPDVAHTFDVRRVAPDLVLFANLGAVQLSYGYDADSCLRLVEQTQADGLILHLNPLQEALQPEGDTRFAGLIHRIEKVCRLLSVPVIAKEVGWGLSARAARWLIDAGVAALDVAGAGGTSWSQVELFRHCQVADRRVAAAFRDWGISTVESLQMVRSVDATIPLIVSGGLRTGIDIAKSLALGADLAAIAAPLLHAAVEAPEALRAELEALRRQLRIAMFVTGSKDIAALRNAELSTVGAPGRSPHAS